MNQKKAKAARLIIGFDPHAPRKYTVGKPIEKIMRGLKGLTPYAVTGTIVATGDRAKYQKAKRVAKRMAQAGLK